MKAFRKQVSIVIAGLLVAIAVGLIYFSLTPPVTESPVVVSRRAIAPTPPPAPMLPLSTPVPDVVIPAAIPLRLQIPVIGLDGAISVYTQAMIDANGGYEPPTLSSIIWDSTVPGGLPGTDSTSTTFLYGHTWIKPAIFNGVRLLKVGDVAIVTTSRGRLCYVVRSTRQIDKPNYKNDPQMTTPVPGQLAIVTCWRLAGDVSNDATTQNEVVILQLNQVMTNAGC